MFLELSEHKVGNLNEIFLFKMSEGYYLVNAVNKFRTKKREECLFRFFSDGGASGSLKFTLTYGKFSRTFSISPLTGRMLTEENAEDGGRL